MRRLVSLAFAVALAGCYHYTPVTAVSAPEGVRIQVLLTDQGTVDVARWVGPSAEIIEGEVMRQDGAELTLAVRRVQRRNGVEEFWKGEPVSIPRAAVASVGRRQLSWTRTALVSAGFAAGVFVLGRGFGGFEGVFGKNERKPPGER
jgi:hypothetical protein